MSESEANKRVCTLCRFCLREDYGYSNYTVEGTQLHCLKGLNDALENQEYDTWREMTPELAAAVDVALTCSAFSAGAPVSLDVEREDLPYGKAPTLADVAKYTDDPEQQEALLQWLTT